MPFTVPVTVGKYAEIVTAGIRPGAHHHFCGDFAGGEIRVHGRGIIGLAVNERVRPGQGGGNAGIMRNDSAAGDIHAVAQ